MTPSPFTDPSGPQAFFQCAGLSLNVPFSRLAVLIISLLTTIGQKAPLFFNFPFGAVVVFFVVSVLVSGLSNMLSTGDQLQFLSNAASVEKVCLSSRFQH